MDRTALAALLFFLVPLAARAQVVRDKVERARDRQELRQDHRDLSDDRSDAIRMEALLARYDDAVARGDLRALGAIEDEAIREARAELAESRAELARGRAEVRRDRGEIRSERREVAAGLDDRRDLRDDRRDLRDDRRDAAAEAAKAKRVQEIESALRRMRRRVEPAAVARRRQLVAELARLARWELAQDRAEIREDRRELREDRRETREDRTR